MKTAQPYYLALLILIGASLWNEAKAQKANNENQENRPKNLHLYLLIGQSNMAGRAAFSDSESKPIAGCFLFDDQDKWIPANNPLNRYSTIRKNLGMQKMNPGYGFAKAMLEHNPELKLGLVVNAKGGTKIEQWAKGTNFYKQAVARTKKALVDGQLKGILWHQGEGNSSKPKEYLPQLEQLIGDLRKDLDAPDVPFVAGQIKGEQRINQEIAKLPGLVAKTGVASSKGLTTFDKWHFDTASMKTLGERYAQEIIRMQNLQNSSQSKSKQVPTDALATRKNFEVAGHKAFVMIPHLNKKDQTDNPIPWVWYAPTLGKNLPGMAEKWMFDRFHRNGIAIAGIDVGESYGNPAGRGTYQEFFHYLVTRKNFSRKPVLLARSRGGLMLYSWGTEHPESVGGIAGIYPVCNIASYPGLQRAAGAYKLSAEKLKDRLAEFNPIDRLQSLAKHKVPIFHIHGDSDKVVPLNANSAIIKTRYEELNGPVEIEVVKGQGHNMWKGWFTSERLAKFVIENAKKQ